MRLGTWLITVPLAILGVVVAVANRAPVDVFFDPFSAEAPAIGIQAPLFLVIFAGVLFGMVIGGLAMWLSQGHYRRRAWAEYRKARDLERALEAAEAEVKALRGQQPAQSQPLAQSQAAPVSLEAPKPDEEPARLEPPRSEDAATAPARA